jgi:hypothetical protein
MTREPRRPATWLDVFGIPIAIGLLSAAGLLSALLFGGLGRIFFLGCRLVSGRRQRLDFRRQEARFPGARRLKASSVE